MTATCTHHCLRLYGSLRRMTTTVLWLGAVLALVGWVCGCSRLPLPESDPAAQSAFDRLAAYNVGLDRFKAVGRLILVESNGLRQSYRIAAAGLLPGNLRIDLLAPFGGSAMSVACDGRHLFAVRHAPREYHRWSTGNCSLKRFVGMSLNVSDVLALMTGRVPLEEERSARFEPATQDAPATLRLYDRRGRLRQQIAMDTAGRPVSSVWKDGDGRTVLSLTMTGEQIVDGFSLPRRIAVNAASGQRLDISLSRYMVNPDLDSSLFVLEPIDG